MGKANLLRRRRPPNQGLWNGVGGAIEAGETPLAACLREVREETGLRINEARFGALVSWTGFEAPEGEPLACEEGELAWQPLAWVLGAPDVVSNIHRYGPEVFAGRPPRWHRFAYRGGVIERHETAPLPQF